MTKLMQVAQEFFKIGGNAYNKNLIGQGRKPRACPDIQKLKNQSPEGYAGQMAIARHVLKNYTKKRSAK